MKTVFREHENDVEEENKNLQWIKEREERNRLLIKQVRRKNFELYNCFITIFSYNECSWKFLKPMASSYIHIL